MCWYFMDYVNGRYWWLGRKKEKGVRGGYWRAIPGCCHTMGQSIVKTFWAF